MDGLMNVKKLENFVKSQQNSFKSLFQRKQSGSFALAVDEDSKPESPKIIPQLSPFANSVVARCSKVLGISTHELQHRFDIELPESVKQLFTYARNFVEFVSYQTIDVFTTQPDFLTDKEFRRLTYDMMLAWETPCIEFHLEEKETSPSAGSQEEDEDSPSLFSSSSTNMAIQVDDAKTVGREAFARIAPACVAIADIITVHNLFDALTSSTSGLKLHFLIYDKYLHTLDKNIKATKLIPKPSTNNVELDDGEIILDADGTIPTQPVLQHIGISAWPGRLILTNYAIYFESLGVALYEKATRYDLATDMKQVIKPDLTGPLGARVFDKAVMYKSIANSDPVYFEFPEFKGNSRRDYWLDVCLEILHAHRFIRRSNLKEVQELDILARASLGILRYHAIREAFSFFASQYKSLLVFSLAESLPKGDKILHTLLSRITLHNTSLNSDECSKLSPTKRSASSPPALLALSRLGFTLSKGESYLEGVKAVVGDLIVGEINPLEVVVKQSMQAIGKAEAAQATVDKVKVEGIDTNIAVMKDLLFPVTKIVNRMKVLASWRDPFKSILFLVLGCFTILRGWTRYLASSILIYGALSIFWRRHFNKKKSLEPFRVTAPANKNAVEQLLTLQEAIAQVETLVQDGNVILLKIRALLFSILPQATEKLAMMLILVAIMLMIIPLRHLMLLVFLETFTREMPYRKESSDRWARRLREWWIRIPAAPVQVVKVDDKKKK
ncbi:unnamed protein product [Linum tenue]|uniref:Uncharacterized protein n=1 Tax=Linum tenue TaxID=586396 RepID=A0AAV0K2I3_9ROSI|nr:unnamed protein product [Linum tenue]